MRVLLELTRFMRPYKRYFLLAIVFVATETLFELTIPLVMSDIIDKGIKYADMDYIINQGLIMAFLAILSLICGLLYAKNSAKAINGFGNELRKAEFAKIQEYSFKNLDHFETSSLITRLTSDVTVIQNALANLRPMVRGPVMLVVGIFYAFRMSPELSLVFLVATPILGTTLILITKKVAPMYGVLQSQIDRLNTVIEENLSAIRIVKAYVRQESEIAKFDKVNDDLNLKATKTFTIGVLNMPIFQFTMYTVVVLILLLGAELIFAQRLEVGTLTGLLSYVLQIMNSLMMISNIFLMLTRSLASAFRVEAIFKEPLDLVDGKCAKKIKDGSIDFDHVFFKYADDAEEYVLSDIDIHIQSGKTIGIIGATGSAKSTLVSLIPRLYDVSAGMVRVGGRDVCDYVLADLRDAVGIVLQKNVLFSGTIRENLLWGDMKADEEKISEALKIAGAYDFVFDLNDGLDTFLEEGGVNLSGGQRQRLCIARALLKRPKILILDDSTSAVDTATEKMIRKGLKSIKDMTKIIIAQRLTSIMDADEIFIIDDGKIAAFGDHKELLKTSAIYKEIYHSQMRGEELCRQE